MSSIAEAMHGFEGSIELVSTRMSRRAVVSLILAGAVAWTSPSAVTAAAIRTTITVRVYQTAGLPPTLEQRALTEAETVLRAARVDARWENCTDLSRPSAACDAPAKPSEFFLRVLREGPTRQDTSSRLGDAIIGRRPGDGVLATVYFNHFARVAEVAETDVALLLGRVAAHELGNLLMHSSAHARRGLMRPNWTPHEVRRDLPADWTFTAGDVAAMRQPAPRCAPC
jgi:hypothetical protein